MLQENEGSETGSMRESDLMRGGFGENGTTKDEWKNPELDLL